MATTTLTGAIYGIGVYGVAIYDLSNVSILVDGVQGVATTDSGANITADANHVVIGVTSAGAVGQVGTIGKAVVIPTGVEATGSIGTTAQVGIANLLLTGVFGTGEAGTVVLVGLANLTVTGVFSNAVAGTAVPKADANVSVTSVTGTGSIDVVTIFENELVILGGVSSTGIIGTAAFAITNFDYNAFADQYSRSRTAYVGRRSTAKERTVSIPYEPRIVLVDRRSTSSERIKLAA